MGYYPVYINLENRNCAVIGDGVEVGKKIDGLLAAGANVIVITEKITPHLDVFVVLNTSFGCCFML